MPRIRTTFRALTFALALAAAPASAETIRIGGTGSALGLMKTLADAFSRQSPGDTLEVVPSLGSAGGIAATHGGVLSLAISVRDLNDKEKKLGLVTLPLIQTPFLFATDTKEQMALRRHDILRIYNGSMTHWADGTPIRLILRPRSDAQAMMLNRLLPEMPEAMDKARQRAELPVAANDHDNMEAATSMKGSFTAFPLVQLKTEPNQLKPVRLDGVEPSYEAMLAGTYELTAQFNLVTKPEPSPGTRRFMRFLGSSEARALMESAGARPLIAPATQ